LPLTVKAPVPDTVYFPVALTVKSFADCEVLMFSSLVYDPDPGIVILSIDTGTPEGVQLAAVFQLLLVLPFHV
jgi:hypothetical protein